MKKCGGLPCANQCLKKELMNHLLQDERRGKIRRVLLKMFLENTTSDNCREFKTFVTQVAQELNGS